LFLAVETQSISKTATLQPSASQADLYAHSIENGVYTNPALGINVKFPDGWTFLDTELLRKEDDERSKEYREANPIYADKGITLIETSNLFVAEQNPSAPVHPEIHLKTQLTDLPGEQPGAYFSENPFFESKGVQFLEKVESSVKGGRPFAHACVQIKAPKAKPLYACVLATVIDSPSKDWSRFVVFQFLSPDLDQARRNAEMIDTIQFSAPTSGAFPLPPPATAAMDEKPTGASNSATATTSAAVTTTPPAAPPGPQNPASGSKSPAANPPANSAPGTARLMNVEDFTRDEVIQTGRMSYLGVYLITLQDGQNEMAVLYRYGLLQHDFTKELHAGMEIPYRIDGKHVFFKSQEGKEVKTSLCEDKGNKLRCADWTFEPRKR
jgi:hypothetical protein